MSDSCYKCPNCSNVTFGITAARNAAPIICPKCKKNGLTVVMTESQSEEKTYKGDGLFTKKKNLKENKELLNEGV